MKCAVKKFEGAEFLTIKVGRSAICSKAQSSPIQSLDVTRGRIDGRILFITKVDFFGPCSDE